MKISSKVVVKSVKVIKIARFLKFFSNTQFLFIVEIAVYFCFQGHFFFTRFDGNFSNNEPICKAGGQFIAIKVRRSSPAVFQGQGVL